jgi:hypothetical protein
MKKIDLSLWFLLLSNLVTIFVAKKENWNLLAIIWIYWFQSVTIGFFNFIRILQLKEFSTKGVEINNQPVKPTEETKILIAFFFLLHYGFFHFICLFLLLHNTIFSVFYRIFLINPYEKDLVFLEMKYIFLVAFLFFLNHLFSYFYNRPRDTKNKILEL